MEAIPGIEGKPRMEIGPQIVRVNSVNLLGYMDPSVSRMLTLQFFCIDALNVVEGCKPSGVQRVSWTSIVFAVHVDDSFGE